jgi:hypothetical protein
MLDDPKPDDEYEKNTKVTPFEVYKKCSSKMY